MDQNQNNDRKANGNFVSVGELDHSLLKGIGTCILNYSVGIMSLYLDGGSPQVRLIGSGTLVQKGNDFAILTAAHVIDERVSEFFDRAKRIGLVFATGSHRWDQAKGHLTYKKLHYEPDRRGPDLGLICIPNVFLSTLKAKKSFWNLDKYRDCVSSLPPLEMGAWTLFGCPAEGVHAGTPTAQFPRLVAIPGLSGFAGIDEDETVDGFDYYRFLVSYAGDSNPPTDFGGVSGGGLWQVPLKKKSDGSLTSDHPILSGVAFWQSPIESDERFVLCHGRNSIYGRAFDAI